MATSSILTNVSIKTREEAERLIEALEQSEKSPDERHVMTDVHEISLLTDKNEIRRIMKKKIA